MANWANPTITTQYDVFVNEAKDRDVDSATMFLNAPTAPPVGAITFARLGGVLYVLREWTGSLFEGRVLAVAGGGTGASDIVAARTALGIGTMGIQNSNAVSITGGVVANLTAFSVSCSIVFGANASYDLASNGARVRRGYFSDALVIPSGVDKYATS